ncbi:divergent PAP2 family protein [Tepidibacillus marianensis]|uniref:divergent PAP2 family protein n=1 Tax=Tepidibacillus marianensis TaxID=3131995 RepID=UPI0030D20CDE
MTLQSLLSNFPLMSGLIAMLFAQISKLFTHLLFNRKWKPAIVFSNGGMPSSHSAFVSSLTTAIGLEHGVESSVFAIAVVFSLITMWDAAGIRYEASKHARVLNVLVQDFQSLVEQLKYKTKREHIPLKELIGHRPLEVFVGSIVGILIGFVMEYWSNYIN